MLPLHNTPMEHWSSSCYPLSFWSPFTTFFKEGILTNYNNPTPPPDRQPPPPPPIETESQRMGQGMSQVSGGRTRKG